MSPSTWPCDAYSWSDLDLDRGFHDTPQGRRFTLGPAARTEVLDRLLELNPYIVIARMRQHNDSEPDLVVVDDERFMVRLWIDPPGPRPSI